MSSHKMINMVFGEHNSSNEFTLELTFLCTSFRLTYENFIDKAVTFAVCSLK